MASGVAAKLRKSCVEVSRILKALAHPRRLMILGILLEGPKTVSELVEACGGSQSQISHFLMRMKLEGLVKAERDGRYVSYSVADRRLAKLIRVVQNEYCE